VDPVPGEVDLLRPGAGLGRGELAKGTVRPDGVVVPQVLGEHPAQLVFMDDQQPVKDPPGARCRSSFRGSRSLSAPADGWRGS